MLIEKTRLGREKNVGAVAKPALDPLADVPRKPSIDRDEAVNANFRFGGEIEKTHNYGTLVRFVGLLALFVLSIGSLVFAITQHSLRGITWMAITTAITGICFYFALDEFSGTKHAPNR